MTHSYFLRQRGGMPLCNHKKGMEEIINIEDAIPWTARKTECGIMVGRYVLDHFEDIHFETFQEYLEWKKKTGAKVIERFARG